VVLRKSLGVAMVLMTILSSGAYAHSAADNDLFKDLVFSGCLPAMSGGSIDGYAQTVQLTPAPAHLAAAFLRGRAGGAYMKVTSDTVLIIAQADGYCTVASRATSALDALQTAVEGALTGAGVAFTFVKEDKRHADDGSINITREFDGKVGAQPVGALFSTTRNGPPPQAVFTVYRKGR